MISAKAGVHHDYVARYFGSREELMIQTIEAAVLGTILAADDKGTDPVSALDANENIMAMVNARLRTMSYTSLAVGWEVTLPNSSKMICLWVVSRIFGTCSIIYLKKN